MIHQFFDLYFLLPFVGTSFW